MAAPINVPVITGPNREAEVKPPQSLAVPRLKPIGIQSDEKLAQKADYTCFREADPRTVLTTFAKASGSIDEGNSKGSTE